MAKRHIDVYDDSTETGQSIGVRDDGAVDLLFGHNLDTWKEIAPALAWAPAGSDDAERWRADCGYLLARVEYDDGLPDVACEPST